MSPRWLLCPLLLSLVTGALAATGPSPRSCAQEIGQRPAQALATTCRALSPATRPPCNAANSCALMQDEIARSCALFGDGEAAKEPGCGPLPSSAEAAAAVVRRYYRALDARDYGTPGSYGEAMASPATATRNSARAMPGLAASR